MLNVVQHLHESGIVHRDLKLENFMLDDEFKLKLIDYGMAAPIEGRTGQGFLLTNLGTEQYKAPEVAAGQAYVGSRVDVFALGATLFTMIARTYPIAIKADANDRNYRYMAMDRADFFWNFHAA